MIVKSIYMTREDGVNLFISYSDEGLKILQDQTGTKYDAAIDVETAPYTYSETDEPVDEPVDPVYHGDGEPMIAKGNITTGQYFSINNRLFLSTQSIAVGEDIIPGKNCIETTVADELNSMTGEE